MRINLGIRQLQAPTSEENIHEERLLPDRPSFPSMGLGRLELPTSRLSGERSKARGEPAPDCTAQTAPTAHPRSLHARGDDLRRSRGAKHRQECAPYERG